MTMKRLNFLLQTILMWMVGICAFAQSIPDSVPVQHVSDSLRHIIIGRIYHFRESLGTLPDSIASNAYMRYNVNVRRRNPAMFFVPNMDTFISGKHHLVGESINKITFYEGDDTNSDVIVNCHTLSKVGAKNIPAMMDIMAPYIYNPTIFKSFIFSPFHRSNRHFYRYQITSDSSQFTLHFKPKVRNPHLIQGSAVVNPDNGQIIQTQFKCEYRMYRLAFDIKMNDGDILMADSAGQTAFPLLPKELNVESKMRFLWNRIYTNYRSIYELDFSLPDTLHDYQDRTLMSQLRPYPLSEYEQGLYRRYDQDHTAVALDSAYQSEHTGITLKRLWKEYGQQLFKTHTTDLGEAEFKLMPIIDPLSLFYSATKGFIYKIRTKAVVNLSEKSALTFAPAGAYNFRRKRCYFELPLSWEFNPAHDAHLRVNMYNTDPISNTGIQYELKHINKNTDVDFDSLNLTYYRNLHMIADFQYAFSSYSVMNIGVSFYRRSPVRKVNADGTTNRTNFTFAPFVEWSQLLWKNGPTFTANYEQGVMNIMGGDNSYGKLELDWSWKIPLPQLRTLSLRLGSGDYFFNNRNQFLDYNKFRDNNLPERWNDSWTGDFQLIDRRWYNASDYYIRNNITYESPLLALSWLPWVGQHIRMERFYINNLWVEKFHPYTEFGYGFATKAFSFAAYVSTINWKYNHIGCKFALELWSNHY